MSERARRALADLAFAFPRDRVTADTLRAYLRALADAPEGELEAVVERLVRTAERFPTVGAIRAAVAEARLGAPDEAGAIAQVEARAGWCADPEGDPPPLHPLVREALAAAGGLYSFRADEGGYLRGQLLRLYRGARARALAEAAACDLGGRAIEGRGEPPRLLS